MFDRLLPLMVLCTMFLGGIVEAAPRPDKVAQVAAGTLKEAKVSWWGFDAEDSTAFLQAAIDSKVPRLIVDKQAGPWISAPLKLVGDQEIAFEEGVELVAKRGLFKDRMDALMAASLVGNLKIVGLGKGATLRMHKADYHTDDYVRAEWRHTLSLRSVENVHVENMSFVSSGGDGIYLGVAKSGVPCRNVVIRKVVCDDNNRQGISVISADKLLIEDCILKNTIGTNPQAGIDFEPNGASEQLTECVMRNCLIEGNNGCGIVCYLPPLRKSKTPISMRIENCKVRNNRHAGFGFVCRDDETGIVKGDCSVVDCVFQHNGMSGIMVREKAADGVALTFDRNEIIHCGAELKYGVPIRVALCETLTSGNIDFGTVRVTDDTEHPPLAISNRITRPERIKGKIELRRNNRTETIRIDDAWFEANCPGIGPIIPALPLDPAKFVGPSGKTSDKAEKFPRFLVRGKGTCWVAAEPGEPVRLELLVRVIGKSEQRKATAVWTAPDGKKTVLKDFPEFNVSKEYELKAPVAGIYRLDLDVNTRATFQVVRCNRPIVLAAPTGLDLFVSTGDLYFSVPAGTKQFGVRARGQIESEAVAAKLTAPDGRVVWDRNGIADPDQYTGNASEGKIDGVWKLTLAKPSRGLTLEDYRLELLGIPSIFGFTPDGLFAPKPD